MPIKRGSDRPGAKLNDDLVRQIRINRNGWPIEDFYEHYQETFPGNMLFGIWSIYFAYGINNFRCSLRFVGIV